jgi:hypothetical protein
MIHGTVRSGVILSCDFKKRTLWILVPTYEVAMVAPTGEMRPVVRPITRKRGENVAVIRVLISRK